MDSAKKGKQRGKGDVVLEDLGRELRHLRALVREVGESFILRREGEIEALIASLATVPRAVLRREETKWLEEVHRLKLKPVKGRLKDLKGIVELVDALTERVMSAQEMPKGGK